MRSSLARNTDPVTSHLAAAEIVDSGVADRQRSIAYKAVCLDPRLTSRELSSYCELDRYQLARRLPELIKMGLLENGVVRECARSGRKALTWNPLEQAV